MIRLDTVFSFNKRNQTHFHKLLLRLVLIQWELSEGVEKLCLLLSCLEVGQSAHIAAVAQTDRKANEALQNSVQEDQSKVRA